MSITPDSASKKSPLDAAQKIVAELNGMPKDDQILALRFATETLRLSSPVSQKQAPPAPAQPSHTAIATPAVPPGSGTDIKSFTETKAPKTDQQFTAVVAYFYQFEAPTEQRRDCIEAATMKDAARMVGRRQVNDWNNTLNNALRSGFLDKGERGTFKLNAVGENLVVMSLPDNAAPRNNGSSTKKAAKKKTAKKNQSKAKKA